MFVVVQTLGSISSGDLQQIETALDRAGFDRQVPADADVVLGLVLLSDIGTPVFDVLRDMRRKRCQHILVAAMSGLDIASGIAWQLLAHGASEFIPWDRTPNAPRQIVARLERWAEIDQMIDRPLVRDHLVGGSAAWRSVLRQVIEVAAFSNASVLVTGESGTGKELIARLIHTLDSRVRKSDLVVLDCSAVVPELSGSEFFGHERGAFTGAMISREGAFAMAHDGTLFLDEVGELPPNLQSQLLRVVQERTFKPLGSNSWRRADFRLVCATNRNLMTEVDQGRFRADLYYRIATWVFRLPPLSERVEDIIPLARHFLQKMAPDREPPAFDEPVREYLQTRRYRGNVRELQQLIFRIGQRHVGDGPITVGDLPEEERPPGFADLDSWQDEQFNRVVRRALAFGAGLRDIGQAASDAAIDIAVGQEGGNLQRAARKLGVTDRALQLRRAQRRVS